VLEARAELDALEDLRALPAVALRGRRFAAFFAAAPGLLQPGTGVDEFVGGLVAALLPGCDHLAVLARGGCTSGGGLLVAAAGPLASAGSVPSLL